MASIDARRDMAAGREPYLRIMEVVEKLSPEETLELVALVEPVPLYRVMEGKGFEHETHRAGDGSWHVIFRPVTYE